MSVTTTVISIYIMTPLSFNTEIIGIGRYDGHDILHSWLYNLEEDQHNIHLVLHTALVTTLEFENTLPTAEATQSALDALCELGSFGIPAPFNVLGWDVLELPCPGQLKHVINSVLLELRVLVSPFAHPKAIKREVLKDQKARRQ